MHPPSDVRVRQRVVGSLIDLGARVTWIGPRTSGGFYDFVDSTPEYRLFSPRAGKVGRVSAVTRLSRALSQFDESPDWIYCPDPDAMPAVLRFASLRTAKVWFDIHENFHESSAQRWLGSFSGNLVAEPIRRAIEGLSKRASLVTYVSPPMMKYYASQHPNTLFLPNAARLVFAEPPASHEDSQTLRVMHGKIGRVRGTLGVAEACDVLNTTGVHATVVCTGYESDLVSLVGSRRARDLLSTKRCARFEILPPHPYSEMPALISSCDVGLISYQGPAAVASLPNRLFEFLARGVPVVVSSACTQVSKLLSTWGFGLEFDPMVPGDLASCLTRLGTDLELNEALRYQAEAAFQAELNWEHYFEGVGQTLMGVEIGTSESNLYGRTTPCEDEE